MISKMNGCIINPWVEKFKISRPKDLTNSQINKQLNVKYMLAMSFVFLGTLFGNVPNTHAASVEFNDVTQAKLARFSETFGAELFLVLPTAALAWNEPNRITDLDQFFSYSEQIINRALYEFEATGDLLYLTNLEAGFQGVVIGLAIIEHNWQETTESLWPSFNRVLEYVLGNSTGIPNVTYHIQLNQTSATVDRCAASPTANFTATLIRTENGIPTTVPTTNFNWSFTQNTFNSTVHNGLITVGRNEVNPQLNLVVSEPRATTNATAIINTAALTIPTTAHATFTDPQTCELWRVLVPNHDGHALIITEHVHGYQHIWFDAAANAYNWSGTFYHDVGTAFVPFESSTLFTRMQLWYQTNHNVGSVLRSQARNYQLNSNVTTPTTGTARVFALTEQEVVTYFGSNSRRSSIRQNVERGRADVTTGWWIRTQSTSPTFPAQFVSYEIIALDIYHPEGIGFNTTQHQGVGFRPALWVARP